MLQRKQLEVLRKKLAESRGKQKEFKSVSNESIMNNVMSVINGGGSSSRGATMRPSMTFK